MGGGGGRQGEGRGGGAKGQRTINLTMLGASETEHAVPDLARNNFNWQQTHRSPSK